MTEIEERVVFDSIEIQKILPHRYPFVLVDKIVELVPGERVVGVKNVTINEPFFQGHFPGYPVMPGVLVLEAMGQTAAILVRSSPQASKEQLFFFVGANNVKWRKQVVPGDSLRIHMHSLKKKRMIWMMSGEVTCRGQLVASADVSAAQG